MERRKTGLVPYTDSRPVDSRTRPLSEVVARTQPMTLAPVASAQGLLDAIAASQSLRSLSEQLSASSAYNGPARILMTGCRPGDGVSTVAAAMALDMSQRLAARTVLVEGQPRVTLMNPMFARNGAPASATVASGSIAVQGTQWPRLETARPEQMDLAEHPARLVEDLDELLMRVGGIDAASEHRQPGVAETRVAIAKGARFFGASRGLVLGVEIENNFSAVEV